MYIEASNNHGRNKFYTRGSHHKWYFPWALPSSKPQVVEAFHDSITRYIANMLSKSGGARPRRLSDEGQALSAVITWRWVRAERRSRFHSTSCVRVK